MQYRTRGGFLTTACTDDFAPGRPIVPHWGLVAGHLAHGGSWLLLGALAARGQLGFSLPGLAWVHTVTLGWLTLVSVTMLVHVLEEILGLKWPGGLAVRKTLAPYALGVLGLVAGFWLEKPRMIAWSAVLVVGALAAWLAFAAAAFATSPVRSVPVRRAFQVVLAMLAATAGIGAGMAWTLGFGGAAEWLTVGPAVHAHLGGLGWLTLLVIGVAHRTFGALFGRRSDKIALHVAALSSLLAAALGVTIALVTGSQRGLAVALVVASVGVLAHLADVGLLARSAVSTHRPPQAFALASHAWLVVALILAGGIVVGRDWRSAYAFVALVGWIGQMVNAHLHHVPVVALGRLFGVSIGSPGDWLKAPLSWVSFAAFQAAIGVVLIGGLCGLPSIVALGALFGAFGWTAMTVNLVGAAQRVRAVRAQRVSAP